MRAPHPAPQTPTRSAILLAALLGGIAVFGLVLAPLGQISGSALTHTGEAPYLALAYSGVPGISGGVTHTTDRAQTDGCTPGGHDIFGRDFVVDSQQWYCDHVTDYGGTVTVLGHVSSDVVAVGGDVVVSGVIDGRALSRSGQAPAP